MALLSRLPAALVTSRPSLYRTLMLDNGDDGEYDDDGYDDDGQAPEAAACLLLVIIPRGVRWISLFHTLPTGVVARTGNRTHIPVNRSVRAAAANTTPAASSDHEQSPLPCRHSTRRITAASNADFRAA